MYTYDMYVSWLQPQQPDAPSWDFLPSLRLIHLGSVPSAPTTPASAPRVPIPRQSHPAESLRSRPVRRRRPPKAASAGGPARPCDHS